MGHGELLFSRLKEVFHGFQRGSFGQKDSPTYPVMSKTEALLNAAETGTHGAKADVPAATPPMAESPLMLWLQAA